VLTSHPGRHGPKPIPIQWGAQDALARGPVIATVTNRNDVPAANVSNLPTAEEHSRQLFGERCRNCHTLKAANAVAQVGPNLDNLLSSNPDMAKRKAFVLSTIHEGRARGNGQMPADLVAGRDAKDVAAFVAAVAGR